MEAPALRLSAVSRAFPSPRKGAPPIAALDGISLTLAPGRALGLVGPDGAGKTTLLRIIAGLAVADSGEVEVLGAPVSRLDRMDVGYMPQSGALYAELSVEHNLSLYARLRGIEPDDHPERFDLLYRLTGLAAFRDRQAGRLSGGMRQKLAMACAVVAAPRLMLLDEPSVGVDPLSRREIWQLARDLATPDTAVVWATNHLDDVALCDDVLLLHEGEVRLSGAAPLLAGAARGRAFEHRLPQEGRRAAVRDLVARPDVIMAGVEGAGVRLLARAGAALPDGDWHAVAPRPDEGFAVLLDNGEPLAPSALAAMFPDRGGDAVTAPAIAAIGLTKRYGAFVAAQDVSFAVRPGEIFGLLGPNGAGKSTTFRMLCALLTPTAGRGTVCGRDLMAAGVDARQVMGYMPQRFSLYADLTVLANLRFVAGAYGLTRREAAEAIDVVVAALRLEDFAAIRAGQLPLGVKQRLSLAAAVMHRPRALFLDEPTSGVDPLVRREFWHHINAIAARGVAVLVTTHFMEEAENCDRLLLINQAEPIAHGTPDEIKRLAGRGEGAPSLEEAFISLIELQRGMVEAA